MNSFSIVNARIINEGQAFEGDIFIQNGIIEKISSGGSSIAGKKVIDAKGKLLIPGVIDDQVHFREPGLTHKASIYTESRAAVAGGITSFMEMPNTVPNTLTQRLLEDKYTLASHTSLANYSFFMGASNDNFEELIKTDPTKVCGIKVFMGSSTGNMLVDNESTLENIFSHTPMLVAVHCEDEGLIKANAETYLKKYGENIDPAFHAEIRSEEACYKSSSLAVSLAKKYNTRLHVLHISTEKELGLFSNRLPLKEKRITAEVCVHHLWFDKSDYGRLGNLIKWNPSIKEARHKRALLDGLLNNHLDIVATDHAPHTWDEKNNTYWKAPSGGPLVQHALPMMLELYHKGKISLEKIVEKMCHAPADCFSIQRRGYLKEGYFADMVLVDLHKRWRVNKENVLYKCGWSALEGHEFQSAVTHTLVSGHLAYENGIFNEQKMGERLTFAR